MKELDINIDELPFTDFLSARYMISAKVNVEKLWKYSKENDLSFFTLSLGMLLSGLNEVPVLKRRIVDNKAVEYDYLDAVCPLIDEDKGLFREMRVPVISEFDNLLDWHDYVREVQFDILKGKNDGFTMDLQDRDEENIANFSCIPWIDFEAATNAVATGNQIQPLITWGKVNENYEMTVSITVSHIFVFGRDIAYFFDYIQDNFNNFEKFL